jgi:hypothetical protein
MSEKACKKVLCSRKTPANQLLPPPVPILAAGFWENRKSYVNILI